MRKTALFILLAITIDFANCAAIEKFSLKHPYNLLTHGYGIVTEDDLAYDNFRREIGPYNPEKSLSELYWQCIPVENVNAGFNAWVGPDGMGPHEAIYTMCTLEITVHANNEVQTFTDRRAHQIDFCLDFTKEWKRLTKNQKFVCLDGEGGSFYDDDKNVGRQKLWTWDKFKTKKGCYSFFAGDCNTSGCGRGKGRCRTER
jgi:hypothetical protein